MTTRLDIIRQSKLIERAPMSDSKRVKFNRPPVVEVVCGVLFGTRQPIRGAHIGQYWSRIRDQFPRVEEAPPLSQVIETLGSMGSVDFGFGFSTLPPLRRTWLLSNDGRSVIQVQEDRFLFNWKKAVEDDDYPSYDVVIAQFNQCLAGFEQYLNEEGVGSLIYRQFELTYINHIFTDSTNNGMKIDPNKLLVDHVRDEERPRFLPIPEGVNWVSVYPLPNQEGRLYAMAQSTNAPDGRRIVRLDMTARGIPPDSSDIGRQGWFDQAHTWITHGFADITAADIQTQVWERTA